MAPTAMHLRLSSFIDHLGGCEVVPRCSARIMEQAVWG